MRTTTFSTSVLGAALMFAGVASAEAAGGRFYDPSNAASPTGYTIGYELYRTIGCPGRELLGTPCEVLDSDGDGVPDFKDKCPDTPAGTEVDKDGCPLPAPAAAPVPAPAALAPAAAAAPVTTVLAGANFDFDKSSSGRKTSRNSTRTWPR